MQPPGSRRHSDRVGGYDELAVARNRISTTIEFEAANDHGVQAVAEAKASTRDALDELAGLIAAGQLEVPIAAVYPSTRCAPPIGSSISATQASRKPNLCGMG